MMWTSENGRLCLLSSCTARFSSCNVLLIKDLGVWIGKCKLQFGKL